jgi:hypothetical protein
MKTQTKLLLLSAALLTLIVCCCSCEKTELENEIRHRVYIGVEYPGAIETHIRFGDTVNGGWVYTWSSIIVINGNYGYWLDAENQFNDPLYKQHYVAFEMFPDRSFRWRQSGTVEDSVIIR